MAERKKIVFLDSDEDTGDAVVTIGAGGVRALEVVAPSAGLPLDVDPADFEDPTNPVNFDAMVSRAEAEAEAEAAEAGVLSFVEDATAVPMPSAADAVRAAGWVPSRVVTAHGATEAPFEGAFASMHSRVTPGPRMPAGLGLGLLGSGGVDEAMRAFGDVMAAQPTAAAQSSRRRERDSDVPAAVGRVRSSGADEIPDVPMSALLPSPDRDNDSPVAPPRSYPVTSTLMRFVDSSDEDQDLPPAAAAVEGVDPAAVDWDAMIMSAGADGIPSLVASATASNGPTAVRREGHADGRSVVQVVDSYRLTLDERDYLDTSVDDIVMNRSVRGQLTFAARAFLQEQETLVGGTTGGGQRGGRKPHPSSRTNDTNDGADAGECDADVAPGGAPSGGADRAGAAAAAAEGADSDEEQAEEEEDGEDELDDAVAIAAVEQLIAVCVAELQRDGERDPVAAALSGAYTLGGATQGQTTVADPNAPVEFVDARAAPAPNPVSDATPTPVAAEAPRVTAEDEDDDGDDHDDEGAVAAATAPAPDAGVPAATVVTDDADADAAPSRPPPLRAFRHFLATAVPALRDVQSGKTPIATFVQSMEGPMFRMQRALVMWNRPTAAPKIVIDGKVMDL